jgi:hypothetical protein
MFQRPHEAFMAVLVALMLKSAMAVAEERSDGNYLLVDEVALNEEDLRKITSQVLAQNPLLSSSPGIKAAFAQRSVRSTDLADVVFYPHTESAGVKSAFQVGCSRKAPDGPWSCDKAEIRRYISLDSQNYEVRVVGPIDSTAAISLIESARNALRSNASTGSTLADTAVMVKASEGGYLVTFRPSEGNEGPVMWARLTGDGDPANPRDWVVTQPEQRQVVRSKQ